MDIRQQIQIAIVVILFFIIILQAIKIKRLKRTQVIRNFDDIKHLRLDVALERLHNQGKTLRVIERNYREENYILEEKK